MARQQPGPGAPPGEIAFHADPKGGHLWRESCLAVLMSPASHSRFIHCPASESPAFHHGGPVGFKSAVSQSTAWCVATPDSQGSHLRALGSTARETSSRRAIEETPRNVFIHQLEKELDLIHYSPRTQKAYMCWINRFLEFVQVDGWFDLEALTSEDAQAFLCSWAKQKRLSVSTQNQAEAALSALFRHLPLRGRPGGHASEPATRDKSSQVLTRAEVTRLIGSMSGTPQLMASLVYGCGLRLLECARLRVHDIDLDGQQLRVHLHGARAARFVPLPDDLVEPVRLQVKLATSVHQQDLPGSTTDCGQDRLREDLWLFPARPHVDKRTDAKKRHHLHEAVLQKSLQKAARLSDLEGRATCQALRRAFVCHLQESGCEEFVIREALGYSSKVRTP